MNKSIVIVGLLIAVAVLGYGWMQRDASLRESQAIERAAKTEADAARHTQQKESTDAMNKSFLDSITND